MIFLRHPAPDIVKGICYGQTDVDIGEEGYAQIEQALIDVPAIFHLVSSPASRCQKLALRLARRDGLQTKFDARLWEMHMGDWEGVAWKNIDREMTEKWLEDPLYNPAPNGECFRDVQNRVLQCIKEIMAVSPFGHSQTAIICHAGPIRAVRMAWEGANFPQVFNQPVPYAEAVVINPPA